jgi:hypothetical protein
MIVGELIFERFVERLSRFGNICADHVQDWPVPRVIGRQAAADRINAEREQPIKLRMKRPETQRAFAQKIPVERLQMSDIENDAMSFWNGAVVQGFGLYDRKKIVSIGARFGKAIKELVTKLNLSMGYRHFGQPPRTESTPPKTLSVRCLWKPKGSGF